MPVPVFGRAETQGMALYLGQKFRVNVKAGFVSFKESKLCLVQPLQQLKVGGQGFVTRRYLRKLQLIAFGCGIEEAQWLQHLFRYVPG